MPLARWIPSCATNKSKNQSTNDDTEHDANIHKRPIIPDLRDCQGRIDVRVWMFCSGGLRPPKRGDSRRTLHLSFRAKSRNLWPTKLIPAGARHLPYTTTTADLFPQTSKVFTVS